MRTSLLFAFLLLTICASAEKNSGIVFGYVKEAETNKPIQFASVALMSPIDSVEKLALYSDLNGYFEFENVPFGSYYLQFQFLSYETARSASFELNKENPIYKSGVVNMTANAQQLEGVQIEAEKNQVEMSLDKRVYNVGQDVNSKGGSAEEILNNVPSVVVDVDGGISLRGSGNVRILIDGKPSGLIGTGSGSGLRQIPASMIERIEVITNPSARYDAQGQAGIINIVLKKEKKDGINGSFELNAGLPGRLGAAANVNFRKKHFNLFANYGVNYNKNPGYGINEQEFTYPDTSFYTNVNRDHIRAGISNSIKLGSDFYWGKNNTLTGSFLYKYSNQNNLATLTYTDLDQYSVFQNITTRKDAEKEVGSDLEWSLNYTKEFDGNKHKLVADIRYVLSDETEDSEIEQLVGIQSTPDLQHVLNQEYERNIIGNVDYIRPFKEKGKIETGIRSTLRNINNPYLVENLEDGEWISLANFSNTLFYTENVHAAYGIIANEKSKWSYQLGLRAEYTGIETYLEETNERYPREYLNLFPSAHFTYKRSLKNAFQLSYSRRINRPGFWKLNPFYSFTDPRNFYAGNPKLNPEFTHSIEAGHMYYWEGGSLLSSVYYRRTTGVVERIRTISDNGTTFTIPINLSVSDALGLEFNLSKQIAKSIKLTANTNLFKLQIDGAYEGVDYSVDAYTMSGRINSQFTLFKNINGQWSMNYRAPQKTPQGSIRARWHSDLGFSRDIMKGNATLSVSARDLFNTRKRRGYTETENFYSYQEFQWRSRSVIASFTYRLNQKKTKEQILGKDDGE